MAFVLAIIIAVIFSFTPDMPGNCKLVEMRVTGGKYGCGYKIFKCWNAEDSAGNKLNGLIRGDVPCEDGGQRGDGGVR